MWLTRAWTMLKKHNTKDVYQKKIEHGSRERENIARKTWLVLIRFSGTRNFQVCVKTYYFLCLAFLSYFCYFETFYFQVFIQWELKWSPEWIVTFALSLLWCWSYLTYKSLKFQFSNHTSFFIFENFRTF